MEPSRPIGIAARIRGFAVSILATTGAIFLIVTTTPLVSWYAQSLAGPWEGPQGDVLIVLSAAGPNFGVIDAGTYWRCAYAVLACREHRFRKVIVSGKDVAPGMRDFLVFSGVPAESVVVENESISTRENGVFTARLLKDMPGRKTLLTSDSHMFRARRVFEKVGVDVAPMPIPDISKRANSWSLRWGLFIAELNETARIGYYFVKGWI
jgi:uncharacterized SAM-binding protein YcdF (DUF218 family)